MSGSGDQNDTLTRDHQGPGIHLVAGFFHHRFGFAGEHGFIGRQFMRVNQQAIGRNTVAFGEYQHIFANHIPSGDTLSLAAADHQGAWARHIPQRSQRIVGAALLKCGHPHDDEYEGQQYQGLVGIAHRKVDSTGPQQ